ncbi:MAG: dTDP-4-dehydrorhamnose reductase [bacterium]
MANLKLLKKKVLISGANGLLGQKLVETFQHDFEVHGLGIKPDSALQLDGYEYVQCDITRRKNVLALVKSLEPNYIINAAAYTNVDGSEEDKETCWKVNVTGVENLAYAARRMAAVLIHISTDYVFDGVDGNYNEESVPHPLGYYGRSKLAGENAVMLSGAEYAILRTMVLYGTGKNVKPNFATWLVGKLRAGERVTIVDDQYGHPTLADDLAFAVYKIVELKKTGLYHVTGSDCDTRYDFALKLADVFGFDKSLIARIKTKDLNQKAPRPLNCSFDLSKLYDEVGVKLGGIEEGLTKLKQQLDS